MTKEENRLAAVMHVPPLACMASLGWLIIAKQVAKPIFFISDKMPISSSFAAHEDIDAVVQRKFVQLSNFPMPQGTFHEQT
jgi:hypothetical protein